KHGNLKVWEICKSSSSAPTYFPCHVMNISGSDVPLIDGGVVANNPTACAIAEGASVNKALKDKDKALDVEKDFLVASFGTGETTRKITAAQAKEWGAAEWVLPMIDVLFDGSADSVDYIATQLLDKRNYFRFQVDLGKGNDDMDNASQENLNELKQIANNYINSTIAQKKLNDLVKRLKETEKAG
ncbi:MAG: hypothetical protein N2C14_19995, partial [Planctomycetales bacterium]